MQYCYVKYMIEIYADNRITSFVSFDQRFQIYYWILWLVGVWWVVGSLWAWGRKDCLARWWEEDDKPCKVGMGFNWEEAKVAMLGISCPVTELSQGDRGQIVTTEGDRDMYCKVVDIVKGNNLQAPLAISAILHKFLGHL